LDWLWHFDLVTFCCSIHRNHTLFTLNEKLCLTTIATPITFKEVRRAINNLKKGKAPGLNGLPPEALKAIDNIPKQIIHKHVSDLFDGTTDHEGWHRNQCVPVPKKGNLSDPNKWRRIMLMEI
jgi:hypothetical protein